MTTNFQRVSQMNEAFNNPKGDPRNIDHQRLINQCKNILDEFTETMKALGAPEQLVKGLKAFAKEIDPTEFSPIQDLDQVRDGLCDIHVFAYGAHHFMGIDADRDMDAVVDGVMTRFIKDEADKVATVAKHATKGVTDVYFEGEYPTMIMKSASDQPDAPKGKFLKSASYQDTQFYSIEADEAADSLGQLPEILPSDVVVHLGDMVNDMSADGSTDYPVLVFREVPAINRVKDLKKGDRFAKLYVLQDDDHMLVLWEALGDAYKTDTKTWSVNAIRVN